MNSLLMLHTLTWISFVIWTASLIWMIAVFLCVSVCGRVLVIKVLVRRTFGFVGFGGVTFESALYNTSMMKYGDFWRI